ncbi:MAG TPA: hypothetical protein VGM62_08400 [Chthoniobacterales bacterium]
MGGKPVLLLNRARTQAGDDVRWWIDAAIQEIERNAQSSTSDK